MTSRSLRTLQQYKQYAESTQQLNEALNKQIQQCYRQIDTLRADLRKQGSCDYQRKLTDYQNKLADLQSRNQLQLSELYNLRSGNTRLENELRGEQMQNAQRARQVMKLEEEVGRQKVLVIQGERRVGDLQGKLKMAEGEINRQSLLLRELQQASVLSVVESRRRQHQLDQGNKLSLTLNSLEQKSKSLEGQLKRTQQDNAWLKQLVADKAALEELLMKQVTTVTNQRINAEKMVKELEGVVVGLRGELEKERERGKGGDLEEVEEKNRVIMEQHETISELQSKLNEHNNLKYQNDRLTQQLQNLKCHLTSFQQQIKKIDPRLSTSSKLDSSRLKVQYAQALRKNNQLIEANARLQISKNQLLTQLENLKKSQIQHKQNDFNYSNSLPSLRLSASNPDNKWKTNTQNTHTHTHTHTHTTFPIPDDFLKRFKVSSGEHWQGLQRKLDNLRGENEMLRKDLSFSGGWR